MEQIAHKLRKAGKKCGISKCCTNACTYCIVIIVVLVMSILAGIAIGAGSKWMEWFMSKYIEK